MHRFSLVFAVLGMESMASHMHSTKDPDLDFVFQYKAVRFGVFEEEPQWGGAIVTPFPHSSFS
jgi:hypothetical protein